MSKYNVNERLAQLAVASGYSQAEALAQHLGMAKADKLRKILNKNQRPDLDVIERTLQAFPMLSAEWLLRGRGSMYAQTQHHANDQTPAIESTGILTTVVNTDNNPVIPIINRKASAGYPTNYNNPEWLGTLDVITHPHLTDGDYFCLQVQGDSMHPTLYNNDYLIARRLHQYPQQMRDNEVYVVVTIEGIMVKRVVNNLPDKAQLVIRSDNRLYPPETIPAAEILEVWEARLRLSSHLPDATEDVQNRLNRLEVDMLKMKQFINPNF